MSQEKAPLAIQVQDLNWDYGGPKILNSLNVQVEEGSRILLIGLNGTGKTTLLRLLAGKHFHPPEAIMIYGRSAFHHNPPGVALLGGDWANNPNVCRDVHVKTLMQSMGGNEFPERRDELIDLLDIDVNWRLHQVSDGERRRVQILLGLIRPFKVLLLDEVTVDLDLIVRQDFLNYLKKESLQPSKFYGTRPTIIYATHIFDGLNTWYTHLGLLEGGKIHKFLELNQVEELFETELKSAQLESGNSKLMTLVEYWLRLQVVQKKQLRRLKQQQEEEERKKNPPPPETTQTTNQATNQNTTYEKLPLLDRLGQSTTTDRYYNYWTK